MPISPCLFLGSSSSPSLWRVYYGDVNLENMFNSRVQKIIKHKDFDTRTNNYDIALLKLDTPLTFNSKYLEVNFNDTVIT